MEREPNLEAVHVGFAAINKEEVDAFYKSVLDAGGKSKASPQIRHKYYDGYYATWVFDLDGYDMEVVYKS